MSSFNPILNIRLHAGKFNNWDHREACVGNAEEWRTYMDTFLSENKELGKAIPKLIHQIWVGPKRMLTYADVR